MKEIHLLILEHLLEGQGTAETLPESEMLADAIFCILPLLAQTGELGYGILLLPCWDRQRQVVMALSCCLTEAREHRQLQHSPLTAWGRQVRLVRAFPRSCAKDGGRGQLRHPLTPWHSIVLLYVWYMLSSMVWGICPALPYSTSYP